MNIMKNKKHDGFMKCNWNQAKKVAGFLSCNHSTTVSWASVEHAWHIAAREADKVLVPRESAVQQDREEKPI